MLEKYRTPLKIPGAHKDSPLESKKKKKSLGRKIWEVIDLDWKTENHRNTISSP